MAKQQTTASPAPSKPAGAFHLIQNDGKRLYWTGTEFNREKSTAKTFGSREEAAGEQAAATEWADANKSNGPLSVVSAE